MMIEIPGHLFTTLIQLLHYASRRLSLHTEKVLDLLFEEEDDEVLDKIFNPLFMEATVEVSRSLFCIKFMKRDVTKLAC